MTLRLSKLKVIIVGLGKIGLGYDLANPEGSRYTHTGAFNHHSGFEVICGVDPVNECRERFECFTGKPAFESLQAISTIDRPDILVIAAPPSQRLPLVRQGLKFSPRLILLEKPLATSVEEGRRILLLCSQSGAGIFVNYCRRCDPAAIEIENRIRSGVLGAFQSGHVCYSGGLANNASHFIDLILYWCGPPQSWGAIGSDVRDHASPDPDIDFWLDLNGRRCVFQAVDARIFSMGQVELIFTKSVLRYEDFGRRIALYRVEKDPDFVGYRRLKYKPQLLPSDTRLCQYNVVDHLYRHLTTGEPLVSTGETALQVLHYTERLKAGCPGE
jgi:predicted dehydrogenase